MKYSSQLVDVVSNTRVKRSAFYCEEKGVLREAKTQIKLSNILQPPESKGHKEGENIMVETLWQKILTFWLHEEQISSDPIL